MAAAGHPSHHVHHFEGVDTRGRYDGFYKQAIRVTNISILSFAEHVQSLLVDYIRNVLQQSGAADRFRTWWTGDRGRYCLAHAGYGGSNNNMGVEVDWRDVKKLVPPSATIGTFTGALMQFISDLSKENYDFLKPTQGLCPSQQVLTKPIYDQMQEFHLKTLLCLIPMSVLFNRALKRFEELGDIVNR